MKKNSSKILLVTYDGHRRKAGLLCSVLSRNSCIFWWNKSGEMYNLREIHTNLSPALFPYLMACSRRGKFPRIWTLSKPDTIAQNITWARLNLLVIFQVLDEQRVPFFTWGSVSVSYTQCQLGEVGWKPVEFSAFCSRWLGLTLPMVTRINTKTCLQEPRKTQVRFQVPFLLWWSNSYWPIKHYSYGILFIPESQLDSLGCQFQVYGFYEQVARRTVSPMRSAK